MTVAITLLQYPGLPPGATLSPPCAKVHMALRIKGLEYRVHDARTPWQVKRHNPRGRVPVLYVGDECIADSSDIVTAIDQRWPDPPLNREDPLQRARIKLLEDWADEVLYFYAVFARYGDEATFGRMKAVYFAQLPRPMRWIVPRVARRIAMKRARAQGVALKGIQVAGREMRECLDALEALLEGQPFAAGEAVSRADLALVATLDQWGLPSLSPENAAELARRPGIRAWRERVHALAPNAAE